MDRRRVVGILLGALAGAAYGTGPLFAKGVYGAGFDWIALLAWRVLFAVIASWVWVLPQSKARAALRALDRRTVVRLLLTGAFFIVNASVYYAAIQRIPISLVALLMYSYPTLVAILSLRLGYPLRGRAAWMSLAIVSAGAILTIGGIEGRPDGLGIGLALTSPILYALYIVATAWMAGERPGATADMRTEGRGAEVPPAAAGAVMMIGTWTAILGIAATVTIANTVGGHPPGAFTVPQAAWPGLIGIGVVAAAVAIQAFYASAARIGAAQASLMATVEPLVTIALGVVFLSETLSLEQVLGGAFVLTGVLLSQWATPPQAQPIVLEEV